MTVNLVVYETYGSDQIENKCMILTDGSFTSSSKKTKQYSVRRWASDFFKSAFLPQGFPDSVSSDYLEYQLWDTMQAFCSSITGTLATRAVLKGYGVGDQNATVAAATMTWMFKDGAGMIGRILFAWLKGSQLDCDAKRWRLFADVLNDIAILIDLVAPFFQSIFVYVTCLSSIARSIVGVSGGATRAALTLHQARRDNMADVSAKDGSQETLVNLMALVAGFIITPLVADNPGLVWLLFFVFTYLHLFANYRAVSAVVMETLNFPRLYLIMEEYFISGVMMKPTEISLVDPIIRRPGYKSSIQIGVRLEEIFKCQQKSDLSKADPLRYVIGCHSNVIRIALHRDVTTYDIQKSAFHGLLLDMALHNKLDLNAICKRYQLNSTQVPVNTLQKTEEIVNELYPCFERELIDKNWDLNRCHLGLDEWRFSYDKKNL